MIYIGVSRYEEVL